MAKKLSGESAQKSSVSPTKASFERSLLKVVFKKLFISSRQRASCSIRRRSLISLYPSLLWGFNGDEKKHFSTIVLFVRCGILVWLLQVIKQALVDRDLQKEKEFREQLVSTIGVVNEICKRDPHIREIMGKGG